MKHYLLILLLSILFTGCKDSPSEPNYNLDINDAIDKAWTPDRSNNLNQKIEEYMKVAHIPGAALAIIKNGEVVHKSYHGFANLESRTPVTDSTEFWLASVSKHITTSLVLDLEEDGILSRKEFLTDIIPNLPDSWMGIRIEHLMSHTSGIIGYSDFSNMNNFLVALNSHAHNSVSLADFISLLPAVKLGPKPGEKFDYSDIGMMILAATASVKAGKPFKDLMQERIFDPSGMNAYLYNMYNQNPNQVKGYNYINWQLTDYKHWNEMFKVDQRAFAGAGSIFVTLGDMIKWNKALNTNMILDDETKQLLWTKYKLNSGETIDYGLGLKNLDFSGGITHGHDGVAGTAFFKFPTQNVDVIILTNLGKSGIPYGFTNAIMEELHMLDQVTVEFVLNDFNKVAAALDTSCLMQGKFDDNGFLMKIYMKENKPYLFSHGANYELIPLQNCEFLAYSKGMYSLVGPPAYFSFSNDSLVVHTKEVEFKISRVD